ncbi:dihydrofolate reductase family protein [Petropleomorpha daqingensis]|uniref:Dihydrofolate reductase n=1 Tax=Petropleomorpha daqingensis TaxID=2026353 RepID=A0A853CDY7_9ACTN|nr:dihydrofolate reductase family protein [Petropleomorpha daqingensis]NYJ06014.1 dihydrofolate reductase [Petropleomorpha daqingensis]
MTRTIYYTATSLDGFLATPDHSLDWLLSQAVDPAGPMGYEPFIAGVGALAMGASTYQWLLDHEEKWPYTMPAWVFTHREFPPPPPGVRFTGDDVGGIHGEMLAAAGDKDVWLVGGGELVGQFADRGLLDEVWVQYAPVTLGAGAPLLPRRLDLDLVDVAHNGNFLCGRYRVAR